MGLNPDGRRRYRDAAGWLAALAMLLAPATGLQAQSLAAIPVEQAAAAATTTDALGSVQIRVHVADPAGLARFLGLPDTVGAASRFLDLRLEPGRHADLGATVNATTATFIVDFDHTAIRALRERMLDGSDAASMDGARVVAFVARSMQSVFAANAELASDVAQTLRGDCTEHALLTAALARSVQIPARIVHGAALVHADGRWQAYGHAWVQTWEAGHWAVRDSAMAAWPGPVYYLPALVLDNEGPGYKLGLLLGFSRMPSRLEILAAAPPVMAPR